MCGGEWGFIRAMGVDISGNGVDIRRSADLRWRCRLLLPMKSAWRKWGMILLEQWSCLLEEERVILEEMGWLLEVPRI